MEKKIIVEIWSDVMCPFCYIGKKKFEAGLANFAHKELVEVIWHSFALKTDITYQPDKDIYSHIAEKKGQTKEWSIKAHQTLVQTAKSVGLEYNFDIVKVTSSFDAHRIIQLAKKHGLADETEERLFKAYFTEGALMSDHDTLTKLGLEIGLDKEEISNVLMTNQYEDEVKKDREHGQQIGVAGIPYFLINQSATISGAQEPNTFLAALENAYDNLEL